MKKLYYALLLISTVVFGQVPGSIDPSFNTVDVGFGNGDGASSAINSTALLPDGKILIGGSFNTYNGTPCGYLARLNPDLSLDTSFNAGTGANSSINNVTLLPDGKILIGGYFSEYNGTACGRIARLNADGSLDTSFNTGTGADNFISSVALQTDGKIIIGGRFTLFDGVSRGQVARLNADGSLDTSFDVGTGAEYTTVPILTEVLAIDIQTDGKVVIGGRFTSFNGTARNYIARLNTDGSLDTSFDNGTGLNNWVYCIKIQPDGKILIGGLFNFSSGYPFYTYYGRIRRLNTDGSFDSSFTPTVDNSVNDIELQPDGKIIIVGNFTGVSYNRVRRLHPNGSTDSTFNPGESANNNIHSVVLDTDGSIIIAGYFTTYDNYVCGKIARLNSNGDIDTGYNPGTGANNAPHEIAVQPDNKIIAVGNFTGFNGSAISRIMRLNADGSADTSFDTGIGVNNSIASVALQADSKIIIGGSFNMHNGSTRNFVSRLNADGSMDTSFNPGAGGNNTVQSVLVLTDGKILVGGYFAIFDNYARSRIARLNADGSHDTTFNPGSGADNGIITMIQQPDGKVIISGQFTTYDGISRNRIARINADGSLDTSFDPGTGANDYVADIALLPDNRILLAGNFTEYNGTTANTIVCIHPDGSIDTSFNTGTGADTSVRAIAVQESGKIIIAGSFTSFNGTEQNYITRINADGTLDTAFDAGTGANGAIYAVAVQDDEKVLIGGSFTAYNGTGRNRIARIWALPTEPVSPDANGILYVKKGENGNGSSWDNALGEVADALKSAKELNEDTPGTVTQIWVAGGIYHPMYRADTMDGSNPADRNNAFVLVPDVQLYGGFAGTETDLADRDLNLSDNTSTLSGDLLGNDASNFTNYIDNTYHVVIAAGEVGTAVLDGFTITAGNSSFNNNMTVNGVNINNGYGAGIYTFESSPAFNNIVCSTNKSSSLGAGMFAQSCNSEFTNIIFDGNNAASQGGGLYFQLSDLTLTDVEFSENSASTGGGIYLTSSDMNITDALFNANMATSSSGGGLYCNNSSTVVITGSTFTANTAAGSGGGIAVINTSPVLTNVTFSQNEAASGGGMYNYNHASSILKNCIFNGNSVSQKGGALHNLEQSAPIVTSTLFINNNALSGGAIFNELDSAPVYTNITVTDNTATNAGGVWNYYSSNAVYNNSIIWGNTATNEDDNFRTYNSTPVITNSLIGDSGGSTAWNTTFGTDGGNNLDIDPEFTDAPNGDYTLQNTSPAGNTGSNTFYETGQTPDLSAITTDLAGNDRFYNSGIVDMGAYELQEDILEIAPDANGIMYVIKGETGYGTSWADALGEVADALKAAKELNEDTPGTVTQIWVAGGTYTPMYHVKTYDGSNPADRNNTFRMLPDVEMYGGFAGTETTLAERDLSTAGNESILSGDFNGDDGDNFTNYDENAYHIVVFFGYTGLTFNSTAVLDGFTVTGGNANGTTTITINTQNLLPSYGAGIFNRRDSSPTLSNLIVTGNKADSSGGGMYNYYECSPIITNVVFSANQADRGGAIYSSSNSTPFITNSIFDGNMAISSGGGLFINNSSPILTNSLFINNSANSAGAIFNEINAAPVYTNITITGNTATNCGGTWNYSSTNVTYNNCIIWGNTATNEDDNFRTYNSTPVISNSLIGDSGGSTAWNTAFGTDGGNNIDVNPLFTNAANGDYTLQNISFAVNAGSNIVYNAGETPDLSAITTDLAGNDRFYNSGIVDMGAYELQEECSSPVPTAEAQTFCIGATVAELEATGTDLLWYDVATGGTALATTEILTTGTYYVSQTLNTCESERTTVTVTVNTTTAPTAEAQTFCIGATVAELEATGTDLLWYDVATGGTPLASTEVLASGTYYVSQILNTCESERTAVTIIVNTTPAPTAEAQTFCIGATVAELEATGTDLLWYDVATGGTPLASTELLTTGTYYVSQTLNTCESERTTVTVTVNTTTAPTAEAQTFCIGATVAELEATGTDLFWYDTATGGTTLASTEVLATGTYYVSQTLNTCESTRTSVAVTVNTTTAPTAEAQTFCIGATVAELEATGTDLLWYDVATGGTALASSIELTTGTYYVSQTLNTCESERTAVTVTVNTTTAPTAEAQTFCVGATVAELEATGTDLKWYTSQTGGSPLNNTTELATGTYYVSQTLNTCESERTAVTVTVNTTTAPTAEVQTFCVGATVAELEATGTDLLWYDVSTGGSPLNNTIELTTGTYYVSQTLNSCESTRTAVTVTVNTTTAPTAEAQTFCIGATIAELEATGTDLLWYDVATGGTPLAATEVLASGTYYVSQTLNTCESTRTSVAVTVNSTTVPTAEAQTFCIGATIAELEATGTDLLWYDVATGGTPLAATTVLATGTYYVSQTLNTCESERTAVTVTVNTTTAPTAEAQTFCIGATVAELEATGTNLLWYDVATGGTALASSTELTTGTYYVSQTLNSCESERTAVTVTVNTTTAPTAEAQTFCIGATIAELEAIGTDLLWYDVATGGTPLAATTAIATGTYYVSQTLNTCESTRTSVTVTVNTTTAPTAEAQTFCIGATVTELEATGTDLQWYDTATGGTPLASTEVLTTGTYYVSQTLNSCESERTAVTIIVNTTTAPTAEAQTFCVGATVAELEATGTNLLWYDVATGGTALASTEVLDSGMYYVSQTLNTCESTRTSVVITVNPIVTPTFDTVAPICAGTELAALPLTSNNGITGVWSPALNNTETTTYTFTPEDGQCAQTATLTITVNPIVTPTFDAFTPICAGATLEVLPLTSNNGINGTWSPALNNTETTTYTFTPEDGQCAQTATLTIMVNPIVMPTFDAFAPICAGAALEALPLTSNNGITGVWSPALNNTETTTYTFTPEDGQCAQTATLTITVNPIVTPTFDAFTPICAGATLEVLPLTSNNGINGTWSPALNNTETTTYTFTPEEGQCAQTTTLTITVNPVVTPTFDAITSICSGATLTELPLTSNNGINGTWSPALNNTETTTYTFTPEDGQCAQTATLTIEVNTIDNGTMLDEVTITALQTGAAYQWVDCENGNTPIEDANGQSFTATENGQYAVIIELGDCSTISECVTINSLDIKEPEIRSDLVIYPNPTSSILNISTNEIIKSIRVFDISGKSIAIHTFANNQVNVDVLEAGTYFIEIETETKVYLKRFIKNK